MHSEDLSRLARFYDHEMCEKYLVEICNQYQESAPTVSQYADDLYSRLTSGGVIQLRELTTLQHLWENGQWEAPSFAANRIYKLEHSLGRDVTGQAGF